MLKVGENSKIQWKRFLSEKKFISVGSSWKMLKDEASFVLAGFEFLELKDKNCQLTATMAKD